MLHEALRRVRGHEEGGDHSHRHGRAREALLLHVLAHLLLDELAHRDLRQVDRVVVRHDLAHRVGDRLVRGRALLAIVGPPLLVLGVVVHRAHPVVPEVAVLALHPAHVTLVGEHGRVAVLGRALRHVALLHLVEQQLVALAAHELARELLHLGRERRVALLLLVAQRLVAGVAQAQLRLAVGALHVAEGLLVVDALLRRLHERLAAAVAEER
mmetsp:Transcript_27549/g.69742  ORF Transcript_27549/g.69742 Transcript_27549/m.69742 type:complete len:213 (-) Transcript_27549:633-1271(-)